jgi:hypothetical protein
MEEKDIFVEWLQRGLGAGRPLDEATRRRAESWFGRSLSDVRIHDSRQAAELAGRLGAEAFAMHSHIIGPAEKLSALTPEGSGLLAHEITHVVQQTNPQPVSREGDHGPISEHGKSASPHGGWGRHDPRPLTNSRVESLQQPAALSRASSSPSGEGGRISLQVSQDALQRTAEEEALSSESIVSSVLANQEEAEGQDSGTASGIDPHELASRVYCLMLRDLVLERERGALPG